MHIPGMQILDILIIEMYLAFGYIKFRLQSSRHHSRTGAFSFSTACGTFFSDYGSYGAISKFPYAPAGLTTMGGYVWWKLVTCCDHSYLIRVEGRD